MALITRMSARKNRPDRLNVHLDGAFAFQCEAALAERLNLRVGATLTDDQLRQIHCGNDARLCREQAVKYLAMRPHSRAELERKLRRRGHANEVIQTVLDDLSRKKFLDDFAFARAKAESAAAHRHQGRHRIRAELRRCGVDGEVARKALDEVFADRDSLAIARTLVEKHKARLKRLEPQVARRRLAGLLQRRGFDYEVIGPLLAEFGEDPRDTDSLDAP